MLQMEQTPPPLLQSLVLIRRQLLPGVTLRLQRQARMPRQDFSQALFRILEIFSLYPAQGRPESSIFAGMFQFCKLTSQMKAFDEFCLYVLFVVQGWAELSLGSFFVFELAQYWQ